ncbi:unnamed protein product [Linum tenue]|uniref:TF-B3 domain-containing protein n=1 Tax=Linum tenue TaxID=586396 RepID=A0AAV0GY51_9ROSI|nr:unnamed protein product [Linum tenue]
MDSPSFFKIILPSAIIDKKLLLPPNFVMQHGGELASLATFIVPDGRTWEMAIVKRRRDGMKMLCRGWSEFTAFYSISHGYLLVFKYKGNSNFHVRIYDPTSCEIEYPNGDPIRSPRYHHGTRPNEHEEGRSGGRIGTIVGKSFEQICKKATPSGKRAIFAAMKLKLQNPSFMLIVQHYNLSNPMAYVPGEFANKYLSPNCSQMKVRDSSSSRGREWAIQFSWRERGGLNLGLGWGAFADDKELEIEDICLFELLKPADCIMKVHIFRASFYS